MADSYPERRFISVLNRMEGILYISDDRAGTRDLAEHHVVQSEYANAVVELVPVADMDLVRALVALIPSPMRLVALAAWIDARDDSASGSNEVQSDLRKLSVQLDAIPPAFLATLEKT